MKRLILITNNISKINKKYKIDIYSRSLSYYFLASIMPITIFAIELLNSFSLLNANFILSKIFLLLSETYYNIIEELLLNIRLNGFSIILIFSIVFNASKVINSITMFSSNLYKKKDIKILLQVY